MKSLSSMSLLIALMLVGVAIACVGHYRAKIEALERNPVTRVRIVPRSMYDDAMGMDWVSESK